MKLRFCVVFALLVSMLIGVSLATAQPSEPSAADALIARLVELPQDRTADGAFVLGETDAPLTLIIFFDWACPHCQTYHDAVELPLLDHVEAGRVRLELRPLPTAGGTLTAAAARLAECVEAQVFGGFRSMYAYLYELAVARQYNEAAILRQVNSFNIDQNQLATCVGKADQIVRDVMFAVEQGVNSTPSVMMRQGDAGATFITYAGQRYDRGPVPLDVLLALIEMSAGEGAG
ncbi:MAG: thioredoxin domain-containing protein [Aggregatilineales bacterium]